jgi:hypothetical protein
MRATEFIIEEVNTTEDISRRGFALGGLGAAGYGTGKAIFGYGTTNGSVFIILTNLVSNTGVVATDTVGAGTARYALAAASYGLA